MKARGSDRSIVVVGVCLLRRERESELLETRSTDFETASTGQSIVLGPSKL